MDVSIGVEGRSRERGGEIITRRQSFEGPSLNGGRTRAAGEEWSQTREGKLTLRKLENVTRVGMTSRTRHLLLWSLLSVKKDGEVGAWGRV